MFETATFESTGQITTQSRKWMAATFLLNGSILTALVLIPLMHPELLPGRTWTSLLAPPAAPSAPPEARSPMQTAHRVQLENPFAAPTRIPTIIAHDPGPQPTGNVDLRALENGQSTIPGGDNVFADRTQVRLVHPAVTGPMRISSRLLEGQIVFRKQPVYPAIAVAAHFEGTVILQATISKTGTIENLRVVSGPGMLRQAAMDAVSAWRYRPYVLNGQPVEVETTVNVVFSLSH
jgi:periplasmic protein TonB